MNEDIPIPEGGKYLPALDGLRGVAISLVLMTHCIAPPEAGFLAWIVRNAVSIGWIGVDIFFAISGFLIGGILLRSKPKPHFFRDFYVRRILRIVPLYGVLSAAVIASAHLLPFGSVGPIWPYLTFTSNLWILFERLGTIQMDGYPLLAHSWSLAIEAQFYVVIALVVFLLNRRRLWMSLLLVLAASPFLRLFVDATLGSGQSYFITFSRLDALALGVLAAVVLHERKSVSSATLLSVRMLAGVLMALTVLLWLTGQINFHEPLFNMAGVSIIDGVAALVVVNTVVMPPRWLKGLLTSKTLVALGRLSYGMYLIHYPVTLLVAHYLTRRHALEGWIGSALFSLLSIGGTLVLANISWNLFEKPILRLKAGF